VRYNKYKYSTVYDISEDRSYYLHVLKHKVSLVEYDIITFPQHLSSTAAPEFNRCTWVHPQLLVGFVSAQSLVFFCRVLYCLPFCPFSSDHCIIWPSVCRLLFVLLSFFLWPLYYLSFSNLQFLIAPLVTSNFSYKYIDSF
jgi:hypothetical protein